MHRRTAKKRMFVGIHLNKEVLAQELKTAPTLAELSTAVGESPKFLSVRLDSGGGVDGTGNRFLKCSKQLSIKCQDGVQGQPTSQLEPGCADNGSMSDQSIGKCLRPMGKSSFQSMSGCLAAHLSGGPIPRAGNEFSAQRLLNEQNVFVPESPRCVKHD
ncbi:hypothetical protein T265_04642 [Opisthorchis viverrini]|uniref:Uncharacterized protein n=1 Tax=Opisthorchis viverrini TaxID=6198 RepID=A0A074ZNB3_OPIVI|nr:hypothetical protein T265_04642 [Opisthorchis viverrini]KER28601.1 hypothetical protein T265_04642 [Opisthorchis viverrini]